MTTTRTILFDSPFLLGFDHTRALIDRAAKAAAESYPPYNVEQIGEAGSGSAWLWPGSLLTNWPSPWKGGS